MRKIARLAWIAAAVLALSLGTGCKSKAKKEAAAVAARKAAKAAPLPKALMGYVGLRSPGKTINETLALVKKFAALPFTRESLLDMLAQQARLPRGIMASVDVEGTFWMLGLGDNHDSGDNPVVMVLPIKSKKAFETALAKSMKKGKADGDLVTYEPKPGQLGMQKIALVIGEKNVYFPSSKKALAVCRPFIEASLLKRKPAHDIEAHVLVEQIFKEQGDSLDEEIAKTMAQMKSNMAKGKSGASPIDQKPISDATEKAVERWVQYLKSTKELVFSLDVDSEQLTIAALGESVPGGALHKVIKRQRTGKPIGMDRLPASSWLVISDHGNPEAVKENASTWEPAVQSIFKDVDPAVRAKIVGVFTKLSSMSTGDFTTAFHRAPSGAGLLISGIGTMKDSAKAKESVDGLIDSMGAWFKAEMKKRGEEMPEGLAFKKEDFSHKGATGSVVKISIPSIPGKAKEMAMVKSLAGMPITLGWAFSKKEMFFALGKESEAQLKLLAEGKVKGKSLADKKDFAAAAAMGKNRVGLLYLSLVDLLRWFKGTDVEKMMPPMLRGELKDAPASPSLDWGVDEEHTTFDLALHLPASHFLVFKPMVDMLMRSGGLPAEALFGGGSKGM